MDYEKKYKEALSWMQSLYNGLHGATKEEAEHYFPELKENEDERIRLAMIKGLSSCGKKYWGGFEVKAAIAWLEKQGTQPRYNIGDILCDKSCTTLNKEAQPNMEIVDIKNGMYICNKGSFPVSQQDEYVLVSRKIDTKLNDESVSNELREASFAHAEREMKNQTFPGNLEFELVYTFEEGAKWDAAQKPIWSKEDEVMLEASISFIKSSPYPYFGDTLRGEISKIETEDWLKSLRPQNTWKPSDEQMKAFEHFVKSIGESGYASPYENNTKLLYSLLEQLKNNYL